MRSKSLRHESSKRRKCVALLALLTPAISWTAEPAFATPSDPGSMPQSESSGQQQTAAEKTSSSGGKPTTDSVNLVPLSPQQGGSYGVAMPLVGPVSRSAGQPMSAPSTTDDDAWFPRGARPPQRATASPMQPAASSQPASKMDVVPSENATTGTPTPSSSAPASVAVTLAAPANELRVLEVAAKPEDETEAAATTASDTPEQQPATAPADQQAEAAIDVTNPEQNEPAGAPAVDEAADVTPHLDESGLESTDTPAQMEIRRLRLNPAGTISARSASTRSGSRMSVGDMPTTEAHPVHDELAIQAEPLEPPRARVTEQPIYGDRINAAGELLLASGPTAANLPVLPQTAQLKPTVEAVLRYYWERPEDAAERTHWGMMHSIMVWDKDTQIIHRRQRYNAVAWMAGNNPCRNQLLFAQDQQGINVRTGVGLQGHQAQLLAIFGLIDVPLDYPVYAGRQKYSVADILEREKLACQSGNELTFTLIALAHYADSDSSWVAADGQDWDMQRLLKEEMSQPIVGSACGGTHRLMGFAHALRRRRAEDKPVVQQWDRADRYVKEFVNYTWTLQNRDGSMSTAWFERPEDNGNMDRKIQTTGHMLEFLLSTVPDSELQTPKMVRTVGYLANTLHAERGHQWQIGPKGHALRALAMYHQRVFGETSPWRSSGDSRRTAAAAAGRGVR